MKPLLTCLAAGVVAVVLSPARAEACGCFTPPDPVVPLVQAGERILFAVDNGHVTAHVQVQYSGAGGDFGWLLPLPSVPTLELGTDELFAELLSTTQPRYFAVTLYDSSCPQVGGFGGGTGGGAGGASGAADAGVSNPGPLVVQDTVGPYDYAVLRADSKDEMLAWLAANRYFVPSGTDDAVTPYINPGAYFLALKLRPGHTSGDLQPVVLRYAGDVGSIPITLTSTGAAPNMGVQVWMLGAGRAIPRNYHHTVVNDALIDWQTNGSNYVDVINRAVTEAPGHHTFVTEYAGPSVVMRGVLARPGRFGAKEDFVNQPTAEDFVARLYTRGFLARSAAAPFSFGRALPSPLKAILARYLPPPENVEPDLFYASYSTLVAGAPPQNYQPQAMADEIWQRVVEPTLAANTLFDTQPTLTRLFTTLSPEDMNRDPAFSFNPSLPDVSNTHSATMRVSCSATGQEASAVLTTEQGWQIPFPQGRFQAPGVALASLPASLSVEVLREEGAEEVVIDNGALLARSLPPVVDPPIQTPGVMQPQSLPAKPAGCDTTSGSLALAGLWVVALLLRRRTFPPP